MSMGTDPVEVAVADPATADTAGVISMVLDIPDAGVVETTVTADVSGVAVDIT